VEEFKNSIRRAINDDPIRVLAEIYEQEMTRIREALDGPDLEDFLATCPNLPSLYPSMHR
jgi:hypothetical protein